MKQRTSGLVYGGFSVLLGLFGMTICLDAHAADTPIDHPGKGQKGYERHITITRLGYGKARPDAATINLPFNIEGESWEVVTKQRDLFVTSLQKRLVPYGIAASGVSISNSQSGATSHDGKTFMNEVGQISVFVRDLSHWKEIQIAMGDDRATPRTVRYWANDIAALHRGQDEAQKSAIMQARKAADRLAGMAGTRVISILEIKEGVIQGEEPVLKFLAKGVVDPIPQEVPTLSAEVTIVFELAPPVAAKPATKPKAKP